MDYLFTEEQQWAVWITAAFVVLDVLSGVMKAAKMGELSSSKMREGLWHKSGYVLIVCLAILIEVGSQHVDIGFEMPLIIPACLYIIGSEVMSIYENAKAINPDLNDSKLSQYFEKKEQ
jgi:toxin secretion/phage lysis holin